MWLTVRIPDLRAFLADPGHAASLTGTVHVRGATERPAVVRDGVLALLAPAEPPEGGARRMDYRLAFTGDDGSDLRLVGHKDVRRRPGNGPWHAATVLATTVGAVSELPGPAGVLTISVPAALRLAISIRATGLPRGGRLATAARALATVARFGIFFTASVARAYLPGSRRPA